MLSMASISSTLGGAYARLAHEFVRARPLLPTYFHLLISAIFPIYTAAHASLRRPISAAPTSKKDKPVKKPDNANDDDELEDDGDDDEPTSPVEALSTSDAVLFPVLAGATLTGLYLIIKWLEDPAILNKILGYYFSWMGTFFTFRFLRDALRLLRNFAYPQFYSSKESLYKADLQKSCFDVLDTTTGNENVTENHATRKPFYWQLRDYFHDKAICVVTARKPLKLGRYKVSVDRLDLFAATMSVMVATLSLTLKKVPWYLTNLSGFAFSYGSLQFMSPGSSATGSLLLSLLFFYDIYMVFYTPMMVTVATKLDVPIKLLFPRPADTVCPIPDGALPGSQEMEEYLKCLAKQKTLAMLGLGDIVVPGIMIAFALRFDLYNYYLKRTKKTSTRQDEDSASDGSKVVKPLYMPARAMWAERLYTARSLWPTSLQAKAFPKPYFNATLVGYTAGMVATLFVMQVYQHAQPALLYLVPGVLAGFWSMAVWRNEIRLVWQYDETEDAAKEGGESKQEEKPEEKSVKEEETSKSSKNKSAISFDVYLPQRLNQQELVKSD